MVRKLLWGTGLGLGIGLVLTGGLVIGLLQSWQDKATDVLFWPRKARAEIVVIAIDDRSINTIGRWPWPRGVHAKLLAQLAPVTRKIGFDVAFPESSTEDYLLTEVLQRYGQRIVLPLELIGSSIQHPVYNFERHVQTGIVNFPVDRDGVVRHAFINNFSTQILDQKPPLTTETFRINYVGQPGTFSSYAYVDVLEGRVKPEEFTNKIVLIGATALNLHDSQLTPVSAGVAMSGVEIHANTIQTILDNKYLLDEVRWITIVAILILALGICLFMVFLPLRVASGAAVVILLSYSFWVIWSFDKGTVRNLIYPVLAIVFSYMGGLVYKYLTESRQKQFIKKALGYYLSESVMQEILKNPGKLKLGGERKEITVLFSDIAGFTSISETMPAEKLAQLLNAYLTKMTEIVFKHNGVLDKYIGDAVMAFWNAPLAIQNHALLACQTALDMQAAMAEFPSFQVRIGIHTGEMVVGNMGSDLRFDYSLLGDNVNLGSRLEGINKEYGTKIVISESTYLQTQEQVQARLLDTVAVKGKAVGIKIYELRSMNPVDEVEGDFIDRFETARVLYEQGKFKVALKEFAHLGAEYPRDVPTQVYITRCRELVKYPPVSWDGIFHAKSK